MRAIPLSVASAACAVLAATFLDLRVARSADSSGEQAFSQCTACHSTNGSNGVGPTLSGIVGRASASAPGFSYSNAMKHAQLHWTSDELDKYLANPQGLIPGNVMPYAGMPDAQQRAALIAYLATLK